MSFNNVFMSVIPFLVKFHTFFYVENAFGGNVICRKTWILYIECVKPMLCNWI